MQWDGSDNALDGIRALLPAKAHAHVDGHGAIYLSGTNLRDVWLFGSEWLVCSASGKLRTYLNDEFVETYEAIEG